MNPEFFALNNTILMIIGMLSCLIIIILVAYVYVNSQRGLVFIWFQLWMAILLIWNFSYMLRLYAPNPTIDFALLAIEVIVVSLLGPVLLCFARAYRGLDNRGSVLVIMSYAGAFIVGVYLLSQPLFKDDFIGRHGQVTTYGLAYVLTALYVGVCFIWAITYFLRGIKNPSTYWKNQMSNIVGAALLVGLAGFIQVTGLINIRLNLPLMVMPIGLILIGIAIMKYQFLDILPYALSEALNFIDDGFMVFGIDGELEDYNKVFFEKVIIVDHCKTIDDVIEAFRAHVKNKMSLNNLKYSITVKNDEFISGQIILDRLSPAMYLQYTSKAIYDHSGMKVASIITFHDMTDLQELFITLGHKKDELIQARVRLEEHISTVQALTVEKERYDLMLEVHDTLGHSMAEVLALLEQCEMLLGETEPDLKRGAKVIDEVLQQSRDSLAEIRETVGKYRKMGVEL